MVQTKRHTSKITTVEDRNAIEKQRLIESSKCNQSAQLMSALETLYHNIEVDTLNG